MPIAQRPDHPVQRPGMLLTNDLRSLPRSVSLFAETQARIRRRRQLGRQYWPTHRPGGAQQLLVQQPQRRFGLLHLPTLQPPALPESMQKSRHFRGTRLDQPLGSDGPDERLAMPPIPHLQPRPHPVPPDQRLVALPERLLPRPLFRTDLPRSLPPTATVGVTPRWGGLTAGRCRRLRPRRSRGRGGRGDFAGNRFSS
jgi:hypothetical protein